MKQKWRILPQGSVLHWSKCGVVNKRLTVVLKCLVVHSVGGSHLENHLYYHALEDNSLGKYKRPY